MNHTVKLELKRYIEVIENHRNGMSKVQAYNSVFFSSDHRVALLGFKAIQDNANVIRHFEIIDEKKKAA